ncbi:hypothetical protein [Allocoleopsis sp.]|uniref:hypothetical protein n=1 Tax=Allocoleopsis sp. TaxID=3088169 RepID=UPI002FD23133
MTDQQTLILTPAQRDRIKLILSVWRETLVCKPSLEESTDAELMQIFGVADATEEHETRN